MLNVSGSVQSLGSHHRRLKAMQKEIIHLSNSHFPKNVSSMIVKPSPKSKTRGK